MGRVVRLFEVGANSRLGAYSNKYGIFPLKYSKPYTFFLNTVKGPSTRRVLTWFT